MSEGANGWREALDEVIWSNIDRDYDGSTLVDHDGIARDLIAMPPAARIAFARELLEGTGRVVAIVHTHELFSTETVTGVYRQLVEDRKEDGE